MVIKKISQREARRLRKRVDELETIINKQKYAWSSDWNIGWVNIDTLILSDPAFVAIKTARKLGHAVVLVPNTGNSVLVYAAKL